MIVLDTSRCARLSTISRKSPRWLILHPPSTAKLPDICTGGLMARHSKSRKTIRYAVVGLGHSAQVAVLPAVKHAQNSELVAMLSSDTEKRRKLAKKYRVSRAVDYNAYDDMLKEIDAV